MSFPKGSKVPNDPNDPTLLYSYFEKGLSGWQARGSASAAQTKNASPAARIRAQQDKQREQDDTILLPVAL